MQNDDLKRFYPQGGDPNNHNDFVRYDDEGKIPGVATDADLQELDEKKADKTDVENIIDGTTPVSEALHSQYADFALQLETDREIEDADEACPPIVFGTVGGAAEVQSGLMKFEEVRGNTIKFNQLVQNGNFASTDGWTVTNGTVTVADGVAEVDFTDTTAASNLRSTDFGSIASHKYLYRCQIKLKNTFAQTGATFGFSGITNAYVDGTTTEWQILTCIDTASSTSPTWGANLYKWAQTELTGYYVKNVVVFDLTAIYGAGNEPSTPYEFFASFPLPYYDYNAGTLLSSKSASLISIGKNQCPGLDEYFPVIPGETYEVSGISAGGYLQEFDDNKTLIKTSSEITFMTDITLDGRTAFCKVQATTYTIPFCYILWSTPNEAPELYSATTVTLPNLTLRSCNDTYDVVYQQGGGKRRVGERPYESGDENDPTVVTDGTTTVYVLETEIDITTTENPGWDEYIPVDNFGTLQFTQDPAQDIPVPQAYFIRYTVNLVEFLDSLYVRCGGDASKIALVS